MVGWMVGMEMDGSQVEGCVGECKGGWIKINVWVTGWMGKWIDRWVGE